MLEPLDVKNHSYKKGLFGYKTADVDDFINSVYNSYSELYSEHAKLKDQVSKLNKVIEDSRMKIFDLESKLQKAENVSNYDDPQDVKKSKEIIEQAQKTAAEIIANAKAQSEKIVKQSEEKVSAKAETKAEAKVEPKVESKTKVEPKSEDKASAASKFFKKAEEEAPAAAGDDDEIFVGEIEDNRKPNKMMIGDGEDGDDGGFEFL